MLPTPSPFLTQPDKIVLDNLLRDAQPSTDAKDDDDQDDADADKAALERVLSLSDPNSAHFSPTLFTSWDFPTTPFPPRLLNTYTKWAQSIIRHPTDIVFLTHTLLYLFTSFPSALYLFHNFTYPHALAHLVMTGYYSGAFTIMLHNHIHNGGVLAKGYAFLDRAVPYVLEPLMGHTWDSYYYHHVKHHHCEGNGPDDLSSTIRYQRDSILHFSLYVLRFLFLVSIELPLYFVRKGRYGLLVKSVLSELASYTFMVAMTRLNPRAALFVLILPFVGMRCGMMVGNWGQHAFVDEDDPDSNFRSSITLIDVPVSPPTQTLYYKHSNLI